MQLKYVHLTKSAITFSLLILSLLFLNSCGWYRFSDELKQQLNLESSNSGSNGNLSSPTGMGYYGLNYNTSFAPQNGTVIKYNPNTNVFDLIYTHPQGLKLKADVINVNYNNFQRTIMNRKSSISLSGSLLLIGDSTDQNFTHYNLGYFDLAQNTLKTIPLNFTDNAIAYSARFAMLKALDGDNYIIDPDDTIGYKPVNDFLNLDGVNESLRLSENYFALGKGFFVANSFANGSSITDKFMVFNAYSNGFNSNLIQRQLTDHLVYQVLDMTDESVVFLTNNTNDYAVFYFRYSDRSLVKVYQSPSGHQVTVNLNIFYDENGNYLILVRDATLQKHFLYKVDNLNGAVTTVAEQDAQGMQKSLFDCVQDTFNTYSNKKSINLNLNQTTSFICLVSPTEFLVAVADFNAHTIKNYSVTTSTSEAKIFQYKDEQYLLTSSGYKTFVISNDQLILGPDNQGKFYDDNYSKCLTIAPSGYTCQLTTMQLSVVNSKMNFQWNYIVQYTYVITDGVTPLVINTLNSFEGDQFTYKLDNDFLLSLGQFLNLYSLVPTVF